MNSRVFLRFFYCTLLCVLIIACKEKPVETSGIILGFSQIGAESSWRVGHTRSVQEAAAQAGVQLLYFNAEQRQEHQIRAIRSFIAYQVDVIAFVPIVSGGWENVLQEAKEAGIPVLICDREIDIKDKTLYAGYLGTNMFEQGQRAANFLLEKFLIDIMPSSNEQIKPVRIVELRGTEGSSPEIQRARGFREVIAEHTEFEIIFSESGDFLRSRGYELMHRVLTEFSPQEIDVIYSHNDRMTLGAIDALKESGIQPGEDIVIISIDAEQEAIDALIRGEINCIVECNPKQGPDIIDLAKKLALGEYIPRVMYMQEEVFTQWDDLSNLMPRGY